MQPSNGGRPNLAGNRVGALARRAVSYPRAGAWDGIRGAPLEPRGSPLCYRAVTAGGSENAWMGGGGKGPDGELRSSEFRDIGVSFVEGTHAVSSGQDARGGADAVAQGHWIGGECYSLGLPLGNDNALFL